MKSRKGALVALTGGIGSGKSTALAVFGRSGAAVLDCDRVVHDLLKLDEVRARVSERLGIGMSETGRQGRKMLAAAVFHDPDRLDQLEAILHPLVRREIEDWYGGLGDDVPLAVVEIQLLFESGMQDLFDSCILVTAPAETRKERMSDWLAPEEFDRRLARQLPEEAKVGRCEFRYDNSSGTDELEAFVRDTFAALSAPPSA